MKEITFQCIADVGDKVYFIHDNIVKTGFITNINIWKDEWIATYSFAIRHSDKHFVFSGKDVDTTIFTDKDKAKQFLKENK